MANDLVELLREARAQGWDTYQTKKGHWKCFAPDGETIVTLPSTPSDHRSLQNAIAQMRRAGFKWKGR